MRNALFVLGHSSLNAAEEGVAISAADLQAMEDISNSAGVDADVVLACEAKVTWGRKPGIRLIRAERERLLADINKSAAEFVVAFGPVAVAALWDSNKLKARSLRDKVHEVPGVSKPVVVTFSLEELAMKPGLRQHMVIDIQRGVWGKNRCEWGEYVVQQDMHPDLRRYLADLDDDGAAPAAAPRVVTVDLETYPGLDPYAPSARIRMVVVSHRTGWAQVVQAGPASEIPGWVVDLLRDPRVLKVGANIRFDVAWLRRFGYEVNNYWCLEHAQHLINENGGLHDLKSLVLLYHPTLGDYAAGQRQLVAERGGKAGDGWAAVRDDEMYQYAGGDGDGGITVHLAQQRIISARDLERPLSVMREWYPAITNIQLAGARVDMATNRELEERYVEEIARLNAEIRGALGPINPRSHVQLARALFETVPDIDLSKIFSKKEDQKKYSTAAAVLRREAKKHPILATVLEFRRRDSLYKFVKGLPQHVVHHHGADYVHSSLRGDITVTYRHSSSKPNLQNLPKAKGDEDDAGLNVKRQYVSRFEGGLILEADQSQLELREAGMISGDRTLFEAFASGQDVHTYLAAMMLGVPAGDVQKEQRNAMKTTNFHVLYGGGPHGLSARLGSSLVYAQELIELFDQTFEGYRAWERGVRREMRENLVVYSRYGAPRRCIRPPSWKSPIGRKILRQAGNAPIQGGSSWHTNLGLVKTQRLMAEQGLRSVMMMTVHDSAVFDVYPGELEAVMAVAREGMERPDTAKYGVDLTIPLVVDFKVGPNWGEMEEIR